MDVYNSSKEPESLIVLVPIIKRRSLRRTDDESRGPSRGSVGRPLRKLSRKLCTEEEFRRSKERHSFLRLRVAFSSLWA